MDTASKSLAKYVAELKYEDLSPEVVRYVKHLILDTLGVAFGGYLSEPSRITRSFVRELGGRPESTVIGSGDRTSSSLAALANGVMVRYLDFMDIYFNVDTCHPSENIPAALAVAEREHADGKAALMAAFIGFEVQGRFADYIPCHRLSWHHVTMGGYTVPLVAGKLLGLSESELANAMGIAGCSNNTTDYVHGQISMIKALGYPLAAQRSIEAALLARSGFTGPADVVELLARGTKWTADVTPVLEGGDKPRVLRTAIKPYAAEFMIHTPVDAMYKIIADHNLVPDDIESMHLKVYEFAMQLADEEAYHPETRERADHSFPYCLAVALLEGGLGPEQFAHEQWKNPKVRSLMSRIKVTLDPELDKIYPKSRPVDLEIVTKTGEAYHERMEYPKGDPNNPMSDGEVEAKFRQLVRPLMSEKQAKGIVDTVWAFEELQDVGDLMKQLVV